MANGVNVFLLFTLIVSITGTVEDFTKFIPPKIHISSSDEPSEYPSIIDSLRLDYLTLEKSLWQLIESGIDTAFVLEQVHIVHLTFFNESFHEQSVYLNDIDTEHLQLFNAIDVINRTAAVLLKNYLHKNPLKFNEGITFEVAKHQINLTEQLDNIENITEYTDFLLSIKNVSV